MPPSSTRKAKTIQEKMTPGYIPPRFTVDLSLPPEHRHDHIAPLMKEAIEAADIEDLFKWLIVKIPMDILPFKCTHQILRAGIYTIARLAFRRVYTDEETAELRGISKATGVSMHLLVGFNVILDLLLGCTSGGVLFDDEGESGDDTGDAISNSQADTVAGSTGASSSRFRQTPYRRALRPKAAGPSSTTKKPKPARMAHFRTLDWGMDSLRHLIVELDFVRSKDGPVVARTVGYFGYVGVLTGVRKGLSMSLNHRATHDGSTWRREISFRWNQIMVLLGQRPSISSTLRYYLLTPTPPPDEKPPKWKAWQGLHASQIQPETHEFYPFLQELLAPTPSTPGETDEMDIDPLPLITTLTTSPSTSAYIILCTPSGAYSLELDNGFYQSASWSPTFLTTTNHDLADEEESVPYNPSRPVKSALRIALKVITAVTYQTRTVRVDQESFERKMAAGEAWEEVVRREEKKKRGGRRGRGGRAGTGMGTRTNHDDGETMQIGGGEIHTEHGHGESTSAHTTTTNITPSTSEEPNPPVSMTLPQIVAMMQREEIIITPELTHYAVVMDPATGAILWRRAYEIPDFDSEAEAEVEVELKAKLEPRDEVSGVVYKLGPGRTSARTRAGSI